MKNLSPEELAKELIRRKTEERCRDFIPNGKQEDYINQIADGKCFIYILSAGNGVGKTALAMNILANLVYGPQNEYFNKGLFKNWPFAKRARIITETKNVEEIGAIDQEIKTWWPKGRYTGSKTGKHYITTYNTDTDWVIDKMTYEQAPKEFAASTIPFVIFDEPPPKAIFDETVMRLRSGGIILITMTPVAESQDAQQNVIWMFEELLGIEDKDIFIMYADMEDNCKIHGVRGHLEHENIEKMLNRLDKRNREARKTGKPQHFSNAIFGDYFVPEVHIIKDDVQPPHGSQFGMTVDPADGKPYAMIWWWVDPRGHIVIDSEWPEGNWIKLVKDKIPLPKMDEYLPIFKQYETAKTISWRIMDRHFGNNRNVRTGKTLIEDWAKLGADFQMSYNCEKEVEVGILKVIEYLKYDKDQPLNAMNLPRLYVKARCKNTIQAIERWTRKIDPVLLVAKPDEKSPYKDFADVVRYTCMLQPEVETYRDFPKFGSGYIVGR